ncbi:MAG: N-acetylmuramic acid 6-phosphate etherase [bacterium]|nr:N-acetylmuramic acid 6-phosphate etherase [bacterium]MDY2830303.1 N-acetylmuramic acid 6-phosphate etherase [Alphaproteobacteria bacterium]
MADISLTEKSNPATTDIDLMDSFHIAQAINNEDKKVALAIEKVLPEIGRAIEMIAEAFQKGGRLAYFGAGTSGRLGVLDASECWPTFGVEHGMVSGFIAGGDKALRLSVEAAEDSSEFGLSDLSAFAPTPNDVIVGISAGGNPQYVLAILEGAKKAGCRTIGISSNPEAKLKPLCDIFINPIVGEEVLTGSSRLKSGTAQKMILNMLSTGAMIRIGKTYKNYMIDVRMVNEKLLDRGCRFVSEIAKISYDEAQKYIEQSGKNVKTACVMAIKKCSKAEAEQQLAAVKGILRKVI